jgi:hypothetical protein
MILLLESMDELNAGLGWRKVYAFLEKLVLVNKQIENDKRK